MQARPLTDNVDAGLDRFITKMTSGSRLFVMVGMLLSAIGGGAGAAAYLTNQECPDGSIPKVLWVYCVILGAVFGLVFGFRMWRMRRCNLSSIISTLFLTATFVFYCAAYMATECNSQTFRGWSDVFLFTSWICVTVAVGVFFAWFSFARPKMKEMTALVDTIRSRQGAEDVLVLTVSTERIRNIYEQQRDNPEMLDITLTRASPSSHISLSVFTVLYWVSLVIIVATTDIERYFIFLLASLAWLSTVAALLALRAAHMRSGIRRSRNIEREIRNLESAGGQQIVLFYQEFPGVSAAFCGERCVLFQPLAADRAQHPTVTTTTRMRLAEEETAPFLVFHSVAQGQVVTATAAERWGLDPGQQVQVRRWIAGAGRAEVFGFQEAEA